MILWGKSQDTHVGLDCEFELQVQRRLVVWISAAFSLDNMLRQDWVGQEGQRILARLTLHSSFPSSPLAFFLFCCFSAWLFFSHLISSEALRQDPVVDVVKDWQGFVDNFRGAPLGNAFRDSFSVGTVGEGEELPVHPASHLGDTNNLSEWD